MRTLTRSIVTRAKFSLTIFSKFPQCINTRYLSSIDADSFDHITYSKEANEKIKEFSAVTNRSAVVLLDRNIVYESMHTVERIPYAALTTIHAIDNVADEHDCKVLCNLLTQSDLQSFMVSPGERKITGDTSVLEYMLSDNTIGIIDHLKRKVQKIVESTYKQTVFEAGCIISWLSPPYAINSDINNNNSGVKQAQVALPVDMIAPEEGTYSYWSAHCDKANNNDYDISVLLYLNNDFTGGDLVFMDDDGKDSIIQPTRGRLVMFNSCIANIHRVQAVTKGNRFLLSIWYSLKRYRSV